MHLRSWKTSLVFCGVYRAFAIIPLWYKNETASLCGTTKTVLRNAIHFCVRICELCCLYNYSCNLFITQIGEIRCESSLECLKPEHRFRMISRYKITYTPSKPSFGVPPCYCGTVHSPIYIAAARN